MGGMSSITGFWDPSFLDHNPPAGELYAAASGRLAVDEPHPDPPERLENVRHILETELPREVTWTDAPPATSEQIHRVHDPDYLEAFRAFCESDTRRFTPETGGNEATYTAAKHAAGAAAAAVDHAINHGLEDVPYACVRPSGHHAQPGTADGFCFLNNAAIGAEQALTHADIDRVAIVDWDVHHGNGTQEVFYGRDDVLVVSVHNDHWPWSDETHPQTGNTDEHGTGDGEGYNVNIPLPPGTGDTGYARCFDRIVAPTVDAFDPDLLVASAGGDAGIVDPMGRNVVTKSGFETLGRRVRQLGEDHADGRLVLLQEGGYQISHLAYAMLGTIEGILGIESTVSDPFAWLDEDEGSALETIESVVEHYERWWDLE
jgi:acetoin utilization deacetylase AcuC-like enzyme